MRTEVAADVDGHTADVELQDLTEPAPKAAAPDDDEEGAARACPICLCEIETSAIGSCTHHFCTECLLEWCAEKPHCPTCRTVVREIRPDPEFDALNRALRGATSADDAEKPTRRAPAATEKKHQYLTLRFGDGAVAGLTLASRDDGPGVRVARARHRDAAYMSGLRKGDILLSMNGVPCSDHMACVELVEAATRARRDVACIVYPRQSRSTRSRTRDAADADSRTRASSVESADGDAWAGGGATATTDDNGMRLPSNLDGAPGCGCRALLRRLAQWAARRL